MATSSDAKIRSSSRSGRAGLGTFAGVFTPSILTILGIILFLRLGFVVGGSGLAQALAVIAAANAVSLLTALSVAAISTNLRVKAGGDYYLISRTLGLSFGGAIGLVLFLAQAVSIGFYCIGFAEAVVPLLPVRSPLALQGVAALAILALGLLAWLGADLATRFQYVVMALLAAALASFAVGGLEQWNAATLQANWTPPAGALPLATAFAIFFPAVTGFTQGVSMSGDLAQPGRSIPRGVLAAVALSTVVYFGCAVLFAAALPAADLRSDLGAMQGIASFGPLIVVGVIAATLSSALASFLGAPRILQSLAKDGIFGFLNPFAAGSGPANNPRRAVFPTLAIALAVVGIGNLNVVAAVVSMFFLVSYGLLNYATYYEARAGSPSFRPTFRFYDRRVGLLGAIVCLGAMLAIDFAAGIIATLIVFAVHQYLKYRAIPATWADGRRDYHMQIAREHLLLAAKEAEHARAWRPQLLVFSDSAARRARLLQFASWVEAGSGLTTVVQVIESEKAEVVGTRKEVYEGLAAEIKAGGFAAFPLVVVGKDASQIVGSVVQAAGVGPFRVNTAVANWPDPKSEFCAPLGVSEFGRNVALAFRLGANLLLLDADGAEWTTLEQVPSKELVIDVWWRDTPTGDLMLLLAYLVTRSEDWQGAQVRLIAPPNADEPHAAREAELRERLEEIRIAAEVVVVPDHEEATVIGTSGPSSLVFLPFRIHASRFYSPFGWEIGANLERLPIVVLALAAQDVELDADPDEVPATAPDPATER